MLSLLPELLRDIGLYSNEERIQYVSELLWNTHLDHPKEALYKYNATLSGGGYPLEVCLSVVGREIKGFSLTVENFGGGAQSLNALNKFLHAIGWKNSRNILESSASPIIGSSQSLIKLYDSVSYTQKGEMKIKTYFAAQDGQFNREVISQVLKKLQLREDCHRIDRVAIALGVNGPDIICLSFIDDCFDGIKCYFTNPYIHLKMINKVALDIKMSIRSYISLLKWYHIVAEKPSGRLGLFGFGLKLNIESQTESLEAYCYGRNEGKEDFSKRIEKIIKPRVESSALRTLTDWRDKYFRWDNNETNCKMLFSGLSAEISQQATLDHIGIYLSFQ
jgi:hypothetical protein